MEEINIFNKKYLNLFLPNDGVEFLQNIMFGLRYTYKDLSSKKAKNDTLFVVQRMLELDLIYVFHWGDKNEFLKDKQFSIKETINYIDSIWFEGADYSDFYGMIMFGHKKWYTDKLENLGMTQTTNWEKFVQDEIGDLEKWIEENKPK
jgi:hypothetical protein